MSVSNSCTFLHAQYDVYSVWYHIAYSYSSLEESFSFFFFLVVLLVRLLCIFKDYIFMLSKALHCFLYVRLLKNFNLLHFIDSILIIGVFNPGLSLDYSYPLFFLPVSNANPTTLGLVSLILGDDSRSCAFLI